MTIRKITLGFIVLMLTSIQSYAQKYVDVSYKNIDMISFRGWEMTKQDFPFFANEGHCISLLCPDEGSSESFAITWVPKDSRITIDNAISQSRSDVYKIMEDLGLEDYTTFSKIYDIKIRGYSGKTFDVKISAEGVTVYKKVIIWEENGYQLSIEKSGGMSKNSFLTYYNDLERSIEIN